MANVKTTGYSIALCLMATTCAYSMNGLKRTQTYRDFTELHNQKTQSASQNKLNQLQAEAPIKHRNTSHMSGLGLALLQHQTMLNGDEK